MCAVKILSNTIIITINSEMKKVESVRKNGKRIANVKRNEWTTMLNAENT